MHKLLLASTLTLFCVLSSFGQLYQVDNREKEQNSTLIIEGKVVEQTSFWNPQHTMIFTSNKIKVYKVFKGEVSNEFIEVMTQGGSVGDISVHASELLELNKDEIGVFFCFPSQANLRSPNTGNQLFDVYASSQGFFKYDLYKNEVGDPFNTFSDITDQFYSFVSTLTRKDFTTVDPSFNVNNFRNSIPANRTNAAITSFSPTTVNAGATLDVPNNVLTINGNGFGTASGNAAILFWDVNVNNGTPNWVVTHSGNEMISWTDTEVKLRVPTRAGTGAFSVRTSTGTVIPSPSALNVTYSILTGANGRQSNLINANNAGGYFMKYSSNMTPEATTTYNRALKTWVEVSGLNVTDGGIVGIASVNKDGNCLVMMDNFSANGGTPLSAGVLGVCYSWSDNCNANSDNTKPEFDIVLRSSYSSGSTSFSYGPCAPATGQIDLETVILHEIGHGLNLGHINDGIQGASPNSNPGKLMHYAVSNGVKRTSPDYSAYQGSLYTINGVTTNYGSCGSFSNMIPLPAIVDAKDEIPSVFPNAATAPGLQINFDLEHATSNKKNDPPYNIILCSPTGTNVTNNLYFPIRTSASGELSMVVSDFQLSPASSATECTGSSTPTVRLALFNRATAPTSPDDYADPVACRSFTGNGAITTITGLLDNTTYLLYVDGKANTKANFKITFNGTALPLRLEKFVGEVKRDYNQLTWAIATFNDVEKIVLQKSSTGTTFSPIHEQYNIEAAKDYSFNDHKPFAGRNYYRLAIHDKDGTVKYSSIVMLNNEKNIEVSVYPNPLRDQMKLLVNASSMERVQINMYNGLGQLILSQKTSLQAGTNQLDLNVSGLSTGIYNLQILNSEGLSVYSTKLQKL